MVEEIKIKLQELEKREKELQKIIEGMVKEGIKSFKNSVFNGIEYSLKKIKKEKEELINKYKNNIIETLYIDYKKRLFDYAKNNLEEFEIQLLKINENKNIIAYNINTLLTEENTLKHIELKYCNNIFDFECNVILTEDDIEYSLCDNFEYFDISKAKEMAKFFDNLENTLTNDLKEICEYL
jgi:hypothetical protein